MNNGHKLLDAKTIIERKLNGETFQQIADSYHVTRQAVYKACSSLPKGGYVNCASDEHKKIHELASSISKDRIIELCAMIMEGSTLENAAAELGMDQKTALACCYYVTSRTHAYRLLETSIFPALSKWQSDNDLSLNGIAKETGIRASLLADYLKGYVYIPHNHLAALKRVSGLSTTDIYKDIFTADNKYLQNALNNEKLTAPQAKAVLLAYYLKNADNE